MNVRGRIKGSRYYIHSKKSRIEAGENEGLDGVTDARGWDTGTLLTCPNVKAPLGRQLLARKA